MKPPLLACGILLFAVVSAQAAERRPAYVLEVPSSVATVFIADTSSSVFIRMNNGPQGPRFVDERYMSIGQNGVGKQRAWDRRTPLGIYFISEELDTTRLHEQYGPVAFPLDYPNPWDRMNNRTGDGIWIHGVDETQGPRPAQDTDGCIALENNELLSLRDAMVPTATPVIIAREMRWATPERLAKGREELHEVLDDWVSGLRERDLYRYFSLYVDDFSYRGMDRDEWARYRVATMAGTSPDEIRLEDLLLLADPEEPDMYLSRFRLTIIEAGHTVRMMKRLYWRRTAQGLKIVAEDDG